MDKDTVTVEWLRVAASKSSLAEIRQPLKDAADMIERQAKVIDRMMTNNADDQAMIRARDDVVKGIEQERDTALAEVERLKASLEARTDDLKALKIEHAVALASSRCQLCGERVEPPRSFCSTCCAR